MRRPARRIRPQPPRDTAHLALDDDSDDVAVLLDSMRAAGAQDQAAALAGRMPGAGMFELFREQEHRQDRFRLGRRADGSPAGPWGMGRSGLTWPSLEMGNPGWCPEGDRLPDAPEHPSWVPRGLH